MVLEHLDPLSLRFEYILDDKKQFFLNRKCDLENVNQENMLRRQMNLITHMTNGKLEQLWKNAVQFTRIYKHHVTCIVMEKLFGYLTLNLCMFTI